MDQLALKAIERIAAERRAPYHSIAVDRLTPIIGAEVSGIDLSQPLSDEQLGDVRRAFLENHVLVFRDQHLTVEQHKAFGRLFGELRALPVEDIDGDDPELVVIRANAQSRYVAGETWHTDGTADVAPSLGSMLYVKETPAIGTGGDTLFANMHKTEHPVVVRHPETGRKSLFVNSGFTSHIVQLSGGESQMLLNMLFDLVAREPVLSCRVRWAPNTLVFWDNRCTQHHAVWDYFPHSRYGERVTILGTRPQP